MYTVKLINEYLHGPIWVYDEDGFIQRLEIINDGSFCVEDYITNEYKIDK